MGSSANASIVYGLSLGEDFEAPWGDDDGGDIEEWWRKIHGYSNPFEPFNESGNWKKELDTKEKQDAEYKKYDEYRDEFDKNAPKLPVEITHAGHGDAYIEEVLYAPGTDKFSAEWSPEKFNPEELTISDRVLSDFRAFIGKYIGEEKLDDIGWQLVPYYG